MGDIAQIDKIGINFSPERLLLLNVILGFVMFGIALELKLSYFRDLLKNPKSSITGIFSQFFLLPFVTFILVWLLRPAPGIALGMILVAACPGGNISNFFSSLSKSNTALSISLTAISTALAAFITPLNFGFWGSLYLGINQHPQAISLNSADMAFNISILLGIPVMSGLFVSNAFPGLTSKIVIPVKRISILIFVAFVITAFLNNYEIFIHFIHLVIFLVFLHNLIAIITGYMFAKWVGLSKSDRRTIAIETGIQNSGLGLILIFNFFNGLGSMAIVAAWWGIWHIFTGFALAYIWSGRSVKVYTK